MNRRDVIIIAVLVNAGLLVVLFASALKSGKDQPEIAVQQESPALAPPMVQNDIPAPRGDEVDQVLSQFASVNPQAAPAQLSPVAGPALQSAVQDAQTLPSFSNEIPPLAPAFSPDPIQAHPQPAVIAEKQEPSFKEVKVKRGDALEKIARAHHTTVQEIMRANHLSSTQLKIGQMLKIPSKQKGVKTSGSVPSATGESKYYTVRNGDNPWTIAVKNHIKVDELLKLNGLDEEKARKLKPGDQLRIR